MWLISWYVIKIVQFSLDNVCCKFLPDWRLTLAEVNCQLAVSVDVYCGVCYEILWRCLGEIKVNAITKRNLGHRDKFYFHIRSFRQFSIPPASKAIRSQFYWHQCSLSCYEPEPKGFYKIALNALARFYFHIRSFHVRNVKQKPPSSNKYWVHYSRECRPLRPTTDSRFSIFSFVRSKYLSK